MNHDVRLAGARGLPAVPRVALALGGGSARGLAHIAMLEAFDEVGIRPTVIAGTSIGAIVGACYAAGLSAAAIRAHAEALLSSRRALLRRLATHLSGHVTSLWSPRHPAVIDGVTLLEMLLPEAVRTDFASLAIPLRTVAVDFHRMEQVVNRDGPVIPAVAASAALPSIFRPVSHGGHLLIDGGFVNPTPFDVVMDDADVTIAVDVTGAPRPQSDGAGPSTADLWTGALHCVFTAVTREKLAQRQPTMLVRPAVEHYATLDFLRLHEIMAASEPAKQALKDVLQGLKEGRASTERPLVESAPPPRVR